MPVRSPGWNSPPRAILAFRVGIVGHRPDRLPKDKDSLDRLARMLRGILEEVRTEISRYASSPAAKTLYSDKPPVVRAVSPLAEGTDRIFANEAIALDYELLCPMPFDQEEFENDFLPPNALEQDSRERFRGLLERAREGAGVRTFELDGERSAASKAYAVAGRVVLNQSDLLIAVWDGGKPAGGGGTVETLQEAVRYHVPVLWIDAHTPHAWQLLHDPDDFRCLEGNDHCVPRGAHPTDPVEAQKHISETVRGIVREEIALREPLSDPHRAPTTQSHASQYFRERKPRLNFAFVWKLFRDAVGSARFQLPKIHVAEFEAQIRDDWPTHDDVGDSSILSTVDGASAKGQPLPSDLEDWVNRRLRPHYAWSDKRGDLYADAYRSAHVLTYLLSATAVFIALLPMAAGLEGAAQTICVVTEFVILLVIVLLLKIGQTRHWHERWMEYRLLAELIRQLRLLIPLGGGKPFPRVPAHLVVYGNLTQTWMYWHMRAIARATGIPEVKVTREYVLDCLSYVSRFVGGPNEGQLRFHRETERRSNHIAHRLHATSSSLFVLTIVSIGAHLLLGLAGSASIPQWLHFHFLDVHHARLDRWLVLLSATLPAFAAALAAISNQGEFARLAKRSAAMADSFQQFAAQIAELNSDDGQGRDSPKLSEVIPLAGKIAEVMVDEVADWRVVFMDRPQSAA
jgi:Protein of unknown function (DUF4231)